MAFLPFFIFLIVACNPKPVDVSKEISDANNGFMEAFNSGNAIGVAANYTADAKLFPEHGEIVQGQDAIEDFWSMVMGMGVAKVSLETVDARAYGRTALEEGKYMLYTSDDQLIDQGKYIVEWKKMDGKWKLYRDIWNTSSPAPRAMASANDTVWVVWNNVKPDMIEQFEDFNFNYLEPAVSEYYPMMKKTVRVLRPVEPNADGTFTYFYLMDPATSPDGYAMKLPLKAKYGEEQANEYSKMFRDCLKGGEQKWVVTVQTSW